MVPTKSREGAHFGAGLKAKARPRVHWKLSEKVVVQDVYSGGFCAVTEGALSAVVSGNPVHRLPSWGTFGGMALVDTDYVNRATVPVAVESQTADGVAAHI